MVPFPVRYPKSNLLATKSAHGGKQQQLMDIRLQAQQDRSQRRGSLGELARKMAPGHDEGVVYLWKDTTAPLSLRLRADGPFHHTWWFSSLLSLPCVTNGWMSHTSWHETDTQLPNLSSKQTSTILGLLLLC